MTCGNCIAKVKSELLKLGDVTSAEVRLQSPQATISMTKHVGIHALQQAISKAGTYSISEAGNEVVNTDVHPGQVVDEKTSYFPIFLIFGFITGISLLTQVVKGSFNWMQWMTDFMAGFFFVFSFFKLMNLRGFAEGYSSYDVVAKKINAWGYIYPFVELSLAIAFFTRFEPLVTNIVTLVVMTISSIGVVQSLLRKTPFQCACLGTVIRLPLSKVTLFEDMLMVVMSLIMIITLF